MQPQPKLSASQLADAVRALAAQSHMVAQARGFHSGNKTPAESVAFVMRNLGLALGYLKPGEGRRGGGSLSSISVSKDGKPVGFPVKLADAVIGICDVAAACGVDLGDAIARKTAWNAARVRRG
jgi:ribosomal protein S18 acetylase RimI-like enzyme